LSFAFSAADHIMPYTFKRRTASSSTTAAQTVPPISAKPSGSKWLARKPLAFISLILVLAAGAAAWYFTQQTKVGFQFTRISVSKPAGPISAFHITVTNTGSKKIVIKKLEVIQGLSGQDLYSQYKWTYMGKILQSKNNIQWDLEFGNTNVDLLSFRVQLTTANGEVYSSARQAYK
jgi:hypothetical protein